MTPPEGAFAFGAFHLAVLAMLAGIAWGLGNLMGPMANRALRMTLGLAVLAHLLFGLAAAGLFRALPIGIAVVGLVGLGLWTDRRRRFLGSALSISRNAVLGMAVVALPAFLLSLNPPHVFDETLYHLPFAKAFVKTGGLRFLADLRFPVFPQLSELLAGFLMLFAGDVATHLVSLLATCLTVALVFSWGTSVANPRAGLLAACLLAGGPLVVSLSGTAYVDPFLMLCATGSLYALDRALHEQDDLGFAVAAGLAGTAASTKYFGLFFVAVVVFFAAWSFGRRRRPRTLLAVAGALLLTMAPTYGRLAALTKNPVFPLVTGVFGSSLWAPDPFLSPAWLDPRVLLDRPWELVIATSPEQQVPLSPWIVAGLPILAYSLFVRGPFRKWVAVTVLYGIVVPKDVRYFVPALPLSCIALGTFIDERLRTAGRNVMIALCALALLPGWLFGIYQISRRGLFPASAAEREAYLVRRFPLLPALAFLDRLHGEDYRVYAIHAENMAYWSKGTLVGDFTGPGNFRRILPKLRDATAFFDALVELRVGYLLIGKGAAEQLPDTPEFRAHFALVFEDAASRVYRLRGNGDRPS